MLKSIYWCPLLFPCLKKIDVESCPKLTKLPLDSESCIDGDELVINYRNDEWIERVQWEDKATEDRFLLCCEKVMSMQHFIIKKCSSSLVYHTKFGSSLLVLAHVLVL